MTNHIPYAQLFASFDRHCMQKGYIETELCEVDR